MKIISVVLLLFSRIMSVRVLFFLMFCKKIFRFSLIIVSYCLWLGGLNWS